jgi:hypothetical protein
LCLWHKTSLTLKQYILTVLLEALIYKYIGKVCSQEVSVPSVSAAHTVRVFRGIEEVALMALRAGSELAKVARYLLSECAGERFCAD